MKKMVFGVLFLLLVGTLIVNYKIISFDRSSYLSSEIDLFENSDFSENYDDEQQFYPNMRYVSKDISYRFENCPISKKSDFKRATEILSEKTVLSFYEVSEDEEILVTCSDESRIEDGMYIAGEGGPKSVILSGNYYVIKTGSVHLIRESECFNPNVAIHETLHALGFEHSENKKNIMYNISFCNQEIGKDTITRIEELYEQIPLPDLAIKNASVIIEKGYLNTTINLRNDGLVDCTSSTLLFKINGKEIKSMNVSGMEIGTGISFDISNLKVREKNIENFSLEILYSEKEIDKENNLLVLKMNKIESS